MIDLSLQYIFSSSHLKEPDTHFYEVTLHNYNIHGLGLSEEGPFERKINKLYVYLSTGYSTKYCYDDHCLIPTVGYYIHKGHSKLFKTDALRYLITKYYPRYKKYYNYNINYKTEDLDFNDLMNKMIPFEHIIQTINNTLNYHKHDIRKVPNIYIDNSKIILVEPVYRSFKNINKFPCFIGIVPNEVSGNIKDLEQSIINLLIDLSIFQNNE
jgi:hypothetical protein